MKGQLDRLPTRADSLFEAGLKDVKMYAGKCHSFASQMANCGMPLNLIGAFLRHVEAKTTKRHAHLDLSGLKIVLAPGPKVVNMKKKMGSGENRPQAVPSAHLISEID